MIDVQLSDFVTIGLLVALEGLLSADNALVMAIMVLGLPRRDQRKALRFGLIGGFALRIVATILAVSLIRINWVKLLGGLYLLYLTWQHFMQSGGAAARRSPPKAKPAFGLSALWTTIVKVEMVNRVLRRLHPVAVAMSPKAWVDDRGRKASWRCVVVGQLLADPALPDAGGRGVRHHGSASSRWRYLHQIGLLHFEIQMARPGGSA